MMSTPASPTKNGHLYSDEWLRAEYEHMWTMQSDINARLVSVYTTAISVGFTAVGALTAWVAADAGKSSEVNAYVRLLVFLLPGLLSLSFFVQNLSQRREVLLLAGYWIVFVEESLGAPTWATRVAEFRHLAKKGRQLPRFIARSNDPIPLSYALLFLSSSLIGAAVFTQYPPIESDPFVSLLVAFCFVVVGCMHISITSRWLSVLDRDFDIIKSKWRNVADLEFRRRRSGQVSSVPTPTHDA